GYLDPLAFLPASPADDPTQTVTTPQPSTGAAASAGQASSASSRTRRARTSSAHARSHRARGRTSRAPSSRSTTDENAVATSSVSYARPEKRSAEPPATHFSKRDGGTRRQPAIPHRRVDRPTHSWRRPLFEPAASAHLVGVGLGSQAMSGGHL